MSIFKVLELLDFDFFDIEQMLKTKRWMKI